MTDNCGKVGNVLEVPIVSLPVGRRFTLHLPTAGTVFRGILVRKGPGTVAVAVESDAKVRKFMSDGELIVIRSTPEVEYWAPTTPVIDLKEDGDYTRWTTKGGTGVVPKADLAEVIIKRVGPSVRHENSDLEEMTDMATKERIAALPGVASTATGKRPLTGAAKAAAEGAATRTPKAPKQLNPCGDGCGEMVKGRFKQGHDSKFYSMLKKLVAGDMKFTDLPQIMRSTVKSTEGAKALIAAHATPKAK